MTLYSQYETVALNKECSEWRQRYDFRLRKMSKNMTSYWGKWVRMVSCEIWNSRCTLEYHIFKQLKPYSTTQLGLYIYNDKHIQTHIVWLTVTPGLICRYSNRITVSRMLLLQKASLNLHLDASFRAGGYL